MLVLSTHYKVTTWHPQMDLEYYKAGFGSQNMIHFFYKEDRWMVVENTKCCSSYHNAGSISLFWYNHTPYLYLLQFLSWEKKEKSIMHFQFSSLRKPVRYLFMDDCCIHSLETSTLVKLQVRTNVLIGMIFPILISNTQLYLAC